MSLFSSNLLQFFSLAFVFEEYWFLYPVSEFGFSWCFLMIRLKLWIFRENATEVRWLLIHHLCGYMISTWFITDHWGIDDLLFAIVCYFVNLSHCNDLSFLFWWRYQTSASTSFLCHSFAYRSEMAFASLLDQIQSSQSGFLNRHFIWLTSLCTVTHSMLPLSFPL